MSKTQNRTIRCNEWGTQPLSWLLISKNKNIVIMWAFQGLVVYPLFCVSCTQHICRVHHKEVGPTGFGSVPTILCILYPAYMPGTSQRGGPHSMWVPPPCEVSDGVYHLIKPFCFLWHFYFYFYFFLEYWLEIFSYLNL